MLSLLVPGVLMGASDSALAAVSVPGQLPLTGVGR